MLQTAVPLLFGKRDVSSELSIHNWSYSLVKPLLEGVRAKENFQVAYSEQENKNRIEQHSSLFLCDEPVRCFLCRRFLLFKRKCAGLATF